MPIVDVELVGDRPPGPGLATDLADRIGAALGAGPGSTWVRLRQLPSERYGESGGVPEGVEPVFVHLLLARRPQAVETVLGDVAREVATATGRPVEHVHVVLAPDGAGRVAFGGHLVS